MRFKTLLVDPPWAYANAYAHHGAAKTHYDCLSTADLCALPVAEICDTDAILLLWCTWPKLEDGLEVLKAWGFRYVTGFPWVKMRAAATPRIGIGFHTRGVSEFVLIGARGNASPPDIEKRLPGIIFSPIGQHSAKPDAQYDFAEAYEGPYIEIFARPDGGLFPGRDGWVQIGNEITGNDIRVDLELLSVK